MIVNNLSGAILGGAFDHWFSSRATTAPLVLLTIACCLLPWHSMVHHSSSSRERTNYTWYHEMSQWRVFQRLLKRYVQTWKIGNLQPSLTSVAFPVYSRNPLGSVLFTCQIQQRLWPRTNLDRLLMTGENQKYPISPVIHGLPCYLQYLSLMLCKFWVQAADRVTAKALFSAFFQDLKQGNLRDGIALIGVPSQHSHSGSISPLN